MTGFEAQRRLWPRRIACGLAALLVSVLIGYALVMGLRAAPLLRALADQSPLALFNLEPPPLEQPKPPERPRPSASRQEDGGSAAPVQPKLAKKPDGAPPAAATLPPPPISLPQPLTQPTPPIAGVGAATGQAPNGASGQGSGGTGSGGNGSGDSGQGSGSGQGDGGAFSRAKQIAGKFRNSDFPASAKGAGRLKIGVRYAIGPSGRVDSCEIIESSGYGEVDAMTCRIIKERYRFRPARDPDGYPVTDVREEDYRWRVH